MVMRRVFRLTRQHGCCVGLASASFTLVVVGCSSPAQLLPDEQPGLAAIVMVINDAYRVEGDDRPVIFLDTDGICDLMWPNCVSSEGGIFPILKEQLEADLQVQVRPPSDAFLGDLFVAALTPVLPETGEVGVTILLGGFFVDERGFLRVSVMVVRSGLDGVGFEYALEAGDHGWDIVEIRLGSVA